MGAHNTHAYFDGKLTEEQLHKVYDEYIEQLLHEYGHEPYNGTLSTCNGLIISDEVFDTEAEAEEYGLEHTNKWGAAMAVKSRGIIRRKKPFTFGGKESINFGNNNPVEDVFVGETRTYVTKVADQLTKAEGARILKLRTAAEEADEACRVVGHPLHTMIAALTNPAQELPPTHFATLKREALKYRKLAAKHQKAKEAFDAYAETLRAKYCTEVVATGKPKWVVSGWAAC